MQIFTTRNFITPILLTLFTSMALYAQQIDSAIVDHMDSAIVAKPIQKKGVPLTGTIKEVSTGNPLGAIHVSVPNYSSAITDENGLFTIDVPSYTVTLFVSGESYETKEVPVKGKQEITIQLHEQQFSSVYDLAYIPSAPTAMNEITGAVTTINTTNKFQTSADTPENYFQGKVTGLNMTRRSGSPGIGTYMTLRGYNSLYGTNQPLVVVDGMIYDTNDYGGSLIANYFSNPLEDIDIKDIDNITVVKDATSTYGSKGGNGAIFITTSHAKELATKIDLSVYTGLNFAPKTLPVMGTNDYRIYLSDALKSRGYSDNYIQSQPYMSDDPSTPGYNTYHNSTNWQNEVLKNSTMQNVYLKVTGGDNIAKYSLSMGYTNHDGIVANTNYKRYTTRFNSDLNITSRLTGNANLSFTYGEHKLAEDGIATKTNPIFISLIKAPILNKQDVSDDGLLSPNLTGVDNFGVGNPVQLGSKMIATNKNYRFFGSTNFNYKFSNHWNASTMFGITFDKIRENFFIPKQGIVPDTLYNALAKNRMGAQVQRTFSAYNDTRIAYSKTFNNVHGISARIGTRYMNSKSEQDYGLGFNSATDELITIGTGVNTLRRVGGSLGKWVWLNYYAGLDYQWNDKYFLSLNMAMDGSSRFGNNTKDGINLFNHRFGMFPSASAGWLVSSENFMSTIDFIELLKFRVSYGLSGNDDIGNYTTKQTYVSQSLLGMQGLVMGNVGNSSLQWETIKKVNAGMDIAFFNERLTMSFDVFQNTTSNMITYNQTSTITGFDYAVSNGGGMQNRGVELGFNSRLIDHTLKFDLGLTLSTYRNKVTQLPYNEMINSYAGATILTRIGQPMGLFYGYQTKGVYATDEDANADGKSVQQSNGSLVPFAGGDVQFVDRNGNGIIDEGDKTIIGNPNPDFYGMFNTHLQWLRFKLDAAWTFTYGNDIYNYTRAQLESQKGAENQTLNVSNRWRAQGQVTNVPKASWGDPMGNSRFSDRWIEDGSYLRLRTISLTYDLPLHTEMLKYATVYITGNNMLTFSKYLGYDPEFSASNNPLLQGIDTSRLPQFKSFLLGIKIGL